MEEKKFDWIDANEYEGFKGNAILNEKEKSVYNKEKELIQSLEEEVKYLKNLLSSSCKITFEYADIRSQTLIKENELLKSELISLKAEEVLEEKKTLRNSHEALVEENEKLKTEIVWFKKEIEEKEKTIKDLEEENKKLPQDKEDLKPFFDCLQKDYESLYTTVFCFLKELYKKANIDFEDLNEELDHERR